MTSLAVCHVKFEIMAKKTGCLAFSRLYSYFVATVLVIVLIVFINFSCGNTRNVNMVRSTVVMATLLIIYIWDLRHTDTEPQGK